MKSLLRRDFLPSLSFLFLFAISALLVYPNINPNASAQTTSDIINGHSISMSSNDTVSIDITPTIDQEIYSATNALNITNTCPNGAIVTLSTNSNSDTSTANNLVRSSTDNLLKTIAPTTGDSLISNSWGYSINNGETFHAVPAKDETPATIYDSSSAASNADTVNVKYGVKLDANIPSGNYTNDILYTIAVKPECLSYTLKWDLNGGTGKTGASYSDTRIIYGSNINLTNYTPTRDGYTFSGWSNGTKTFTGNETSVNINEDNANTITLTANWEVASYIKDFSYTGSVQTFTVPHNGNYKIELWGSEGGTTWSSAGGAYTAGNIELNKSENYYVYVGRSGTEGNDYVFNYGQQVYSKTGGGATDIRLTGGSWDNFDSLKSRIMVAGGGGGQGGLNSYDSGLPYGGAAGGLTGYKGGSCIANRETTWPGANDATQTSGQAFGRVINTYTSSNANSIYNVTGGNGYYSGNYYNWTGTGGHSAVSGAGGGSSFISGYSGCNAISSSSTQSKITHTNQPNHYSGKVFTSGVMIDGKGCNWSTGSAANCGANQPQPGGTKTAGHTGNGYARITYLGN